MHKLTAEEANVLAKKYYKDPLEESLEEVLGYIKHCAEQGEVYTMYYNLPYNLKQPLRELGYIVEGIYIAWDRGWWVKKMVDHPEPIVYG